MALPAPPQPAMPSPSPPATRSPQVLEEIKQLVPQVDTARLGLLEQRLGGGIPSMLAPPQDRPLQASALRSVLPGPAVPSPMATVATEPRKDVEPKAVPTSESSSSEEEDEPPKRARSPTATAAPVARTVSSIRWGLTQGSRKEAPPQERGRCGEAEARASIRCRVGQGALLLIAVPVLLKASS